jgi:glycosyltransferase involved in cell wall biosynthesis
LPAKITVAIPCYNEAPTIARVVAAFRAELPEARVLVVDNSSTDGSAELARAAGAEVRREKRRGKGFVMQAIFESVDADLLVIVDGDDTYYAEDVRALLAPVMAEEADMVVGDRLHDASREALNDLHRFGNRAILRLLNLSFGTSFRDVLSGYRVVNRELLRRVPLIKGGFETETELTLQALENALLIKEVPIRYRARPEGSVSKLSAFADGYRILLTIAALLRSHRPLYFFGVPAALLALAAVAWGGLWAFDLVPAYRTAVHLAVVGGLAAGSALVVLVGLLQHAIAAGFQEMRALSRRPR